MYSVFTVTLLTNLIMAVGKKGWDKKIKLFTYILSLMSHSNREVLSHLKAKDTQCDTAAFQQSQEAKQHLMKPGTTSHSKGQNDTL